MGGEPGRGVIVHCPAAGLSIPIIVWSSLAMGSATIPFATAPRPGEGSLKPWPSGPVTVTWGAPPLPLTVTEVNDVPAATEKLTSSQPMQVAVTVWFGVPLLPCQKLLPVGQ
jgi:hypothetical protein